MIKVLFLSANAQDRSPLDIHRELKGLTKAIKQGEFGDLFELRVSAHASLEDLETELRQFRPHILHFAGHGHDSIFLEEEGQSHLLSAPGLSRLVALLRGELRGVVLNACTTAPQAESLAAVVDHVVGMQSPVSDETAIRFTGSFYRALAAGDSVPRAFELALAFVDAYGRRESEQPRLYNRPGGEAAPLLPATRRVFVIWDFATPSVRMLLEGMREVWDSHDGCKLEWNILGLDSRGGQIAELVQRGIREAHHVIALVDSPNANVGWEVGQALGHDKSLQFAYVGKDLPAWAQIGALKNLVLHKIQDVMETPKLLKRLRWRLAPAPSEQAPEQVLLLCPGGPEGTALRARAHREHPALRRLPDEGFGLYEVPALLAGCRRVIWTIASYPEKVDVRDGAENSSAAVIAGLAAAWGLDVVVLRSAEARVVVDVQPRERVFSKIAGFGAKLATAIAEPLRNPGP